MLTISITQSLHFQLIEDKEVHCSHVEQRIKTGNNPRARGYGMDQQIVGYSHNELQPGTHNAYIRAKYFNRVRSQIQWRMEK